MLDKLTAVVKGFKTIAPMLSAFLPKQAKAYSIAKLGISVNEIRSLAESGKGWTSLLSR